jgi:hypothetical protein
MIILTKKLKRPKKKNSILGKDYLSQRHLSNYIVYKIKKKLKTPLPI